MGGASAGSSPKLAFASQSLAFGSAAETAVLHPAFCALSWSMDDQPKKLIPFTPTDPSKRHDGWTAARQTAFVEALAQTGCVDKSHLGRAPRVTPRTGRHCQFCQLPLGEILLSGGILPPSKGSLSVALSDLGPAAGLTQVRTIPWNFRSRSDRG